jgi:hypothetical protein
MGAPDNSDCLQAKMDQQAAMLIHRLGVVTGYSETARSLFL